MPDYVYDEDEFIQHINTLGTAGTAKEIGISVRNVGKRKAKLVKEGKLPPPGYKIKGQSTLRDSDGEVVMEWTKTDIDKDEQERLLREALKAMAEKIPAAKPVKPHKIKYNDQLTNLHVLTDYHFGALAWDEETKGDNWDTDLAEKLIIDWFTASINSSPDAEVGILAQLGDLLHFDGLVPITPASGNVLDADTRFQRVVRIVIRCLRQIIQMMLVKYKTVWVIMADANHDPSAGVWLREFLKALYEDEPRVTVDVNPDTYNCYEWGQVSLFFHHGHKKKIASIDDVFAAKFREVFGRTKFSYAHMGHFHSVEVKETNLMLLEQHRTMAASDAYASRGGWISGRSANVITYHKEYGEVARTTYSPEMFN